MTRVEWKITKDNKVLVEEVYEGDDLVTYAGIGYSSDDITMLLETISRVTKNVIHYVIAVFPDERSCDAEIYLERSTWRERLAAWLLDV